MLTYLAAEAVSHAANLGDGKVFLQGLDAGDDDGVYILGRVRVVAVGALGNVLHDIILAPIKDLVAVEDVGNQGRVAGACELVCEELAVVGDGKDVGDQDDASASFVLVSGGLGHIGCDLSGVDLDVFASRCAPGFRPG